MFTKHFKKEDSKKWHDVAKAASYTVKRERRQNGLSTATDKDGGNAGQFDPLLGGYLHFPS